MMFYKSSLHLFNIQYDCVNAPLNVNGVAFSWWNDRNGTERYFWSGSNSSTKHPVCQGGIEDNCFDDFLPCNCDSILHTQLFDSGNIITYFIDKILSKLIQLIILILFLEFANYVD